MAKKKSKKKTARKPASRRIPWYTEFLSPIIDRVLAPTLILDIRNKEAFSTATSLARLHSLFEAEHGCSIPRAYFDRVASLAGVSFSKGISFQQNNAPSLAQPGRILNSDAPADQVRLTAISSPFLSQVVKELNTSEPEGEDGFKITNDAVSPEAAANDEARRQAQIDAAIAEANGEVPETVIIPRR